MPQEAGHGARISKWQQSMPLVVGATLTTKAKIVLQAWLFCIPLALHKLNEVPKKKIRPFAFWTLDRSFCSRVSLSWGCPVDVGCSAASLVSTHQMPAATSASSTCDNSKCLQTLPNVHRGTKTPLLRNHSNPAWGSERLICPREATQLGFQEIIAGEANFASTL